MRTDSPDETVSRLRRWFYWPKRQPLRRLLFRIHVWSGIGLGLYIAFISLTGSVLVYRNELLEMAMPEPPAFESGGALLEQSELVERVQAQYPRHEIVRIVSGDPDASALEIWLQRDGEIEERYFDRYSGADVGSASRAAARSIYRLIELHKNLLGGDTGMRINGAGGLALVLMASTGIVIWWPGARHWRRSLRVHRDVNRKRQLWELHSSVGFWSFPFILMFGASGAYLCYQDVVYPLVEWLVPPAPAGGELRWVDRALYWLAFLHFGRLNGIALPCDGPGVCDQTFKAIWALFGLAPAVMFASGASLWWNRVLRRRPGRDR